MPVKKIIKRIVRGVSGLIPERFPPATRFVDLPDAHVFFGYYDLQPWSPDQNHILFTSVKGKNISPHDTAPMMDLYCMDVHSGDKHSFAKTAAWNWQQGCRLQWFGDESAVYNHYNEGRYGATVANVKTGASEQKFSAPLHDVSKDRQWALSVDFARLHTFRRGYGYHQSALVSEKDIPEDDGIYLLNLSKDRSELIVSLADLARLDPRPDMADAKHYFNHLKFNPEGTRFLAFHIWISSNGKRQGRLFTADRNGKNIRILAQDVTPSHYAWMDNEHILLTGKIEGIGERYMMLKDCAEAVYTIWDKNFLHRDGHPCIVQNSDIISDIYPDILGVQKLFCVENGVYRVLASSHFPYEYQGEMRCDMHPRLSPYKDTICIDFVRCGRRAMALIPFKREQSS